MHLVIFDRTQEPAGSYKEEEQWEHGTYLQRGPEDNYALLLSCRELGKSVCNPAEV